jgi:NADH:ubiquinone oxidoreductase subunit 3 (subunit A)
MKTIKIIILYILVGIEMTYLSAVDFIADNVTWLQFIGTFILFLLVGYIAGKLIKNIWNL